MSLTSDSQVQRALLLTSSLQQLEREAARFASAATIHALSNYILTIRIVLQLVATRVGQGNDTEADILLDVAETSLRLGRVLIMHTTKPFRRPASSYSGNHCLRPARRPQ